MLRALVKKQFLELFALLFVRKNKKNKKLDKKNSVIKRFFLVLLFVVIFLVLMSGVGALASFFALTFFFTSYSWLYFAMISIIAICSSVLVNIFIASSILFTAKDNELLLSLPIPPKDILFSRMIVLYANCLFVSAVVWVPSLIVFILFLSPSILSIVFSVVLLFLVSLLSCTISCLLGWLVAFITKNKTSKMVLTVVFSLFIILLAFSLRIFMQNFMIQIAENTEQFANLIYNYFFPFYMLGNASLGNVFMFFICMIFIVVLFLFVYFVLSNTFIKIVTTNKGTKRKTYVAKENKSKSIISALLSKEFSLFIKTPVYLINAGLGVVLLLVGLIVFLVQFSNIQNFINNVNNIDSINSILPAIIISIIAALLSFDAITMPSMSLEGKNLWILKSLPIVPKNIFYSKIYLHMLFNGIPALICLIVALIMCKFNIVTIMFSCFTIIMFLLFFASFGMFVGIKRVNLTWTNPTIPVKQNLGLLFVFLVSWLFIIIFDIMSFALVSFIDISLVFCIFIILLAIINFLLFRWLKTSGVKAFVKM